MSKQKYGKGSEDRVKDFNSFRNNYDEIKGFGSNKKNVEVGKWDYDPFHETWSRIENGTRVWYDIKPE